MRQSPETPTHEQVIIYINNSPVQENEIYEGLADPKQSRKRRGKRKGLKEEEGDQNTRHSTQSPNPQHLMNHYICPVCSGPTSLSRIEGSHTTPLKGDEDEEEDSLAWVAKNHPYIKHSGGDPSNASCTKVLPVFWINHVSEASGSEKGGTQQKQ